MFGGGDFSNCNTYMFHMPIYLFRVSSTQTTAIVLHIVIATADAEGKTKTKTKTKTLAVIVTYKPEAQQFYQG